MGSPSPPLCTPRAFPHPPRCRCSSTPTEVAKAGLWGGRRDAPKPGLPQQGWHWQLGTRNGCPKSLSPPSTFSARGLMEIPGGSPQPRALPALGVAEEGAVPLGEHQDSEVSAAILPSLAETRPVQPAMAETGLLLSQFHTGKTGLGQLLVLGGYLGQGQGAPKPPQSITAHSAPFWRGNKALAQLLEPPGTGNKSMRRGLPG